TPVAPPALTCVDDEPALAVGSEPEPRLTQRRFAHAALHGPGSRVTGSRPRPSARRTRPLLARFAAPRPAPGPRPSASDLPTPVRRSQAAPSRHLTARAPH